MWAVARSEAGLTRIATRRSLAGQLIGADLGVPGTAERIISDVRPAVTFNAAGYGIDRGERDAALHQMINVDLPRDAASAVARLSDNGWHGQRLVHLGSGFEYGTVHGTVTEATAAAGRGQYPETKLAGTRAVQQVREKTGARVLTARVYTVYGPGERPQRLLPTLIRAGQTGESIELTAGSQERDFTYVEDIAEGVLRLGMCDEVPPVVNLATGVLTSVRCFAEAAMELAGIEPGHVHFGALPYRTDEVWQGRVDVGLLEQTTAWRPRTTIREGIRATLRTRVLMENAP